MEKTHSRAGNNSAAEDTNRDDPNQVLQTKLPNGKEPLNSQIVTAKPLGFPTEQDVGCFQEDVGLELSQVEEKFLPACPHCPWCCQEPPDTD